MTSRNKKQIDALLRSAIDSYHAGTISQAIKVLADRANQLNSPKVWGYLGFLYTESGDHAKAVQVLRKAVRLSPRSEPASVGLFHSLWRTGRTNAAFNEMRRFIKSNDSTHYRQLLCDMLADPPGRRTPADKSLAVA
jgi:uncharacterized protein HemY